MAVAFIFDFEKARAAILYLATKNLPDFDKGKTCKLLFLADKRHLVQYGRPVTGDQYWALEHGPVPTQVLSLLDDLEQNTSSSRARELSTGLDLDRRFENPRFRARLEPDMSVLSRSDIGVLDRIADLHGRKTFAELRALTHEMVAYQRAWRRRAGKRAATMAFEDFFEEDADAIAGAREEMLENAALRKMFPAP
jgi:uncharacterized phage-associated protein